MKKFEYRTIVTEERDGGEELREAGAKGWEAYSMYHRTYHSVNMHTTYHFYLKREITQKRVGGVPS
jgi:hypothetical protein